MYQQAGALGHLGEVVENDGVGRTQFQLLRRNLGRFLHEARRIPCIPDQLVEERKDGQVNDDKTP